MNFKNLEILKIKDKNITPRAYFELEYKHLKKIGVKINDGIIDDVPSVRTGRLYFKDITTLRETVKDIKILGCAVVIEHNLTRIIVYNDKQKRILGYYLKGRDIECQGIYKYNY